jgi:DNA-binding LacI/PurR family transcriptional regulator
MNLHITKRGAGKTQNAILESSRTNHVIICINDIEKRRILSIAKEMGLEIPQPVTFDDYKRKSYLGRSIRGFIMDNADIFIQSFSNIQVNSMTVSN